MLELNKESRLSQELRTEKTASQALCPFCRADYKEHDHHCWSCGALFPWAADRDRLLDEMKEREPNRVRATATLVAEVFDFAKGGKPPSLSALKGLLFAWLFPRAIIVVGSVIAGVALILQTWILSRQTDLMRTQSVAAQFQQQIWLHDRLAGLETMALRASEIRRAVDAIQLLIGMALGACKSDCANLSFASAISKSPLSPEAQRARNIFSAVQQDIKTALERTGLSAQGQSNFSKKLEGDVVVVARRCGVEAERLRKGMVLFQSLLGGNGLSVVWALSDARAIHQSPSLDNADIAVGEFLEILLKISSDLRGDAIRLNESCQKVLEKERTIVEEVEAKTMKEYGLATAAQASQPAASGTR